MCVRWMVILLCFWNEAILWDRVFGQFLWTIFDGYVNRKRSCCDAWILNDAELVPEKERTEVFVMIWWIKKRLQAANNTKATRTCKHLQNDRKWTDYSTHEIQKQVFVFKIVDFCFVFFIQFLIKGGMGKGFCSRELNIPVSSTWDSRDEWFVWKKI